MALSKVDFNNINVTPAASKALKWNSSANGFETGDLGGNMVLGIGLAVAYHSLFAIAYHRPHCFAL